MKQLTSYYACINDANIPSCYGITQHPKSKDYILVLQYANAGNLYECLQGSGLNEIRGISQSDKHKILINITQGLKAIDEASLIHCDLHPGNILVHKTFVSSVSNVSGSFKSRDGYFIYDIYIRDLGMCYPPDTSLKTD